MRHEWFPDFGSGFGPRFWAGFGAPGDRKAWRGRHRHRHQVFESGEVKYVILRLLEEKPRHGYEIMKALEERLEGWYTPSPGTVYPTLQLLEDQGYVRAVETEGKKVYHITPEGKAFLREHREFTDDIFDRVRDMVGGFAAGGMGELNAAFARLARQTYRNAWRLGPDSPRLARMAAVLEKAAAEVEEIAGE
ncbi:MAG TPA: PadR family transcriptional regulator [Vicinamibacteria bacterium]|nr:PadR family transcriptional regulator [Vicinamibacteria bacterium]